MIAVTGSKGFLGQYVLQRIREFDSREVLELDLPEWDITTDSMLGLARCSAVIHLAAMKGLPQCDSYPLKALDINTRGTLRMLEACRHLSRPPKFVYASTWAVESPNKKMYDVSKKAAEECVLHYAKNKGLDACIARLGTCYGVGMAPEGAISAFMRRASENEPATVRGNGKEIRQFTHARDVANGLVILAKRGEAEKIYNIVADEVVCISRLARKICKEVEFVASTEKPESYQIFHSDEIKKLGWKQHVSLDDGVQEMKEALRISA